MPFRGIEAPIRVIVITDDDVRTFLRGGEAGPYVAVASLIEALGMHRFESIVRQYKQSLAMQAKESRYG